MKSIGKFLFTAIATFSLSCNPDLINEPPLGQTEADFFQNADEFRRIVVGSYAAMYDHYHFSAPSFNFGGWVTANFLLPGDDLTETNGSRTEVELFDGSLNPTNQRTNFSFQAFYKMIARANVVIQKVNELDISELDGAEEIGFIGGEAYFLRGYAFFQLATMYGSVPIVNERITTADATNTPKSPREDVFTQAIEDFRVAIDALPDSWSDENRGRVFKNSARGMLVKALVSRANYFGSSGDYQEALTVFGSISGSTDLVPDFLNNFNAFDENNAESLYELQANNPGAFSNLILHNDGPWRGVENMSVYRGYMAQAGSGPGFNDATSTRFLITDKLFDAFGTDPRLSVFLRADDGNNGRVFQKYVKPAENNDFDGIHGGSMNNERLLRYADVKLLAAEAAMKTGSPAIAIGHINDVRTRAREWGASSGAGDGVEPANRDTNVTDQATILQWIRDERYIELCGEGHRYWDLTRWHAAGDINLAGWDFSTNLSSPVLFDVNIHTVYPIPQTEIERNSAITENNPGY